MKGDGPSDTDKSNLHLLRNYWSTIRKGRYSAVFKENEMLCAVCCGKRLLRRVHYESKGGIPSTSALAVAARYVFSPAIFEALDRTLPDRRGEIQLTDAIRLLIQQGQPVQALLLAPDQLRYDVGNFESYFRTFIDLALADERYGYLVRKYIKAKAYEL